MIDQLKELVSAQGYTKKQNLGDANDTEEDHLREIDSTHNIQTSALQRKMQKQGNDILVQYAQLNEKKGYSR